MIKIGRCVLLFTVLGLTLNAGAQAQTIHFGDTAWKSSLRSVTGKASGFRVVDSHRGACLEITAGVMLQTARFPCENKRLKVAVTAKNTAIEAGDRPHKVAWVTVCFFDRTGREIGHRDLINTGIAADWKSFQQEIDPPADAAACGLRIGNAGKSGSLWISQIDWELTPVVRLTAADAMLGPSASIVAADPPGGERVICFMPEDGRTTSSAVPEAIFRFRVEADGLYRIAFRVNHPRGIDRVFSFALAYTLGDQATPVPFHVDRFGGWTITRTHPVRIAAGEHRLSIRRTEQGLRLSGIAIESVAGNRPAAGRFPLPPILPPPGHPRLLIRPGDMAAVKARLTAPENLSAWNKVQAMVEKAESGILTPEDMTAYGNLSRTKLNAAYARAFYYLMGMGDGYGKDALAILRNILDRAVVSNYLDVTRDVGFAVYVTGIVYDWCYPLLTNADKKYLIGKMEEYASMMEIGYPPFAQGAVVGHAGEAQLFRDQLTAAIAIYDEKPDWYHAAAGRLFAEMIEPRNFAYCAGRHSQGSGYGPVRFLWELHVAILYWKMSGKMIFSPEMAGIPYSFLYSCVTDGDAHGEEMEKAGSIGVYPALLYWHYNLFRDPVIKGEFFRQGRNDYDPINFLLINDPSIPVEPRTGLPLTRYSPEPISAMVCRTGWDSGPAGADAVVEMKGPGYYFANHQHLDAGNFQIYYRGLLAADLGAYKTYGNAYHQNFEIRSVAHNVMLAYDPLESFGRLNNDGGQRLPAERTEPKTMEELVVPERRTGTVIAHDFGPDPVRPAFSIFKMDIKDAYSDKLCAYVRSFCFLNLGRADFPAALIVFDRMETARPEIKKYWQLNSFQEPAISAGKVTILRDASGFGGKLVCTTLLPAAENLEIIKTGGPGQANSVFGKQYAASRNTPAATGWRTMISPAKPAAVDTFLHVLQIGPAEPLEMPRPELIRLERIVGVSVADRVVTFSADGRMLDVPFIVPVRGDAARYQVLATDLRDGWWTIARSGEKPFMRRQVSAAGHHLFWTAMPGDYVLRPEAAEPSDAPPLVAEDSSPGN
jgi:heparin/heparan-sulfate lyase